MLFLAPSKAEGLVWDGGRLRSGNVDLPPISGIQMKVNQGKTQTSFLAFPSLSGGCSDEGVGGRRLRQICGYHSERGVQKNPHNNRLIE